MKQDPLYFNVKINIVQSVMGMVPDNNILSVTRTWPPDTQQLAVPTRRTATGEIITTSPVSNMAIYILYILP